MKEFRVLKRAVMAGELLTDADFETWTAEPWSTVNPRGVVVRTSNRMATLDHENQIESVPDAPADLKAYVRAEILAHRPEVDDEARAGRALYRLRWHEGRKQIRYLNRNEEWYDHARFIKSTTQARAEAWFEKNKPAASEWQEVAGAPGYAIKKRSETKCLVRDPNTDDWEIWKRPVIGMSSDLFSFPEPVIAAVCRLLEIPRADVLREDETMNEYGRVLKIQIQGSGVLITNEGGGSTWWDREFLESHTGLTWVPRALAYLNKHAPKLAGNQFRVVNMIHSVRSLRWHDGQPQSKLDNGPWCPWFFEIKDCDAEDAWFRAKCPADRFVTYSGDVVGFRMREDGSAEAVGYLKTLPDDKVDLCDWLPEHQGLVEALYAFRDAERERQKKPTATTEISFVHDGKRFTIHIEPTT